jgi:hypothetical protein
MPHSLYGDLKVKRVGEYYLFGGSVRGEDPAQLDGHAAAETHLRAAEGKKHSSAQAMKRRTRHLDLVNTTCSTHSACLSSCPSNFTSAFQLEKGVIIW